MAERDEGRTGVGGGLRFFANQAAWRYTQINNAITYGALPTIGRNQFAAFGKQFFLPYAADTEMTRWRAGASWGKLNVLKPLTRSWSPTRISMSAQFMASPSRYSNQAFRFFAPSGEGGYVAAEAVERAGSAFNMFGLNLKTSSRKALADHEARLGRTALHTSEFGSQMTEVGARAWADRAMMLGSHAAGDASKLWRYEFIKGASGVKYSLKQMTVGSLMRPGEISATERYYAPRAIRQAMERMGGEGTVDVIGSAGRVLEHFGAKKTAATLTTAGRVLGYGARMFTLANTALLIATAAKDAAELVYHSGEAVFYKLPKRVYGDIGSHVSRPNLMGVGANAVLAASNTATNRQRAVQAIQGSRLNARSALGNEAGLLSGHFG